MRRRWRRQQGQGRAGPSRGQRTARGVVADRSIGEERKINKNRHVCIYPFAFDTSRDSGAFFCFRLFAVYLRSPPSLLLLIYSHASPLGSIAPAWVPRPNSLPYLAPGTFGPSPATIRRACPPDEALLRVVVFRCLSLPAPSPFSSAAALCLTQIMRERDIYMIRIRLLPPMHSTNPLPIPQLLSFPSPLIASSSAPAGVSPTKGRSAATASRT